jgi:hypothetical protein
MTVSNVSIRNVHSCGLFRTVAQAGSTIDGVYASNLYMASADELGDAAIKIGWNGPEDTHQTVRPREHRNIVVENAGIDEWDGPVCTIQQPVSDLTLRSVRATHSGPFLWNEEHDVDGLTIEDCASVLVGEPPGTLLNDFYRSLLDGERWIPGDQYRGDVLEDPPGIIHLDHGTIRDVSVRNSRFSTDTSGGDRGYPMAIRIHDSATVDGVTIDTCSIDGFTTGLRIDQGATVRHLTARSLRQREVSTPWDTNGVPVRAAGNDPEYRLLDAVERFDPGECRRFPLPGDSPGGFAVCAVPVSPGEHAYRTETIRDGASIAVLVEETRRETGGDVRVLVEHW